MAWWGDHGDDMLSAVLRIAAILVGYFIVRYLVFQVIRRLVTMPPVSNNRLELRQARVRALQTVLHSTAGFVLGFIAVIMVLQATGINIVPLITTASVAGLAIGFGAQKLVKDVISGFFILAEDHYGVGDYVTISGVSGVVEDLGMRTTSLCDSAGKLFIISNGDIVQVFNHSRGTLFASTDVTIPASTDLDKTKGVLNDVGKAIAEEMPGKVTLPFKCGGLSQLGGDKISVRFSGGVVAMYQDEIMLTLNERIRRAFAENDLPLA
jgi:small conductance mechanosensitive channel